MKKIFTLLALAFCASVTFAGNVPDALKVKTFTLSNGMEVWINEDPSQISAYGAVIVKAGAADCPGTGIAHYFEHMMFKGTDKIGTIDYAAEKPYLDSIAVLYDKLAAAPDSLREGIQMEINRVSIQAADYAIPNEYNNLISETGGSELNAFTSYDETVYHNRFLPEYFEQWAELNSERIMNPVFRLFQSELETVYEEKNRSDDNLVSDFRNQMLSNLFDGTPYSEQVIGTTENLKNPRLSQMREFFETYYVGSNMGLVLTGNIKAEEVMPIIEEKFGRIRKGEPCPVQEFNLTPIKGNKEVETLINMPMVKIGALCFRGPSTNDPDNLAVNFISTLLNNDSSTGLLDKMMVDHKLMIAMANDLSFKHAGGVLILYMPKLLFQSDKKAAGLVMGAIDKIKSGDFSDDYFESCKLSFKKQLIQENESLGSRLNNMIFALSAGQNWDDILAKAERIDAMTKEDLMAVANKYFGDDYIHLYKKKGTATVNKLKKPGYEKVVPKNKDNSSAYAQAIREKAAQIKITPRVIDYEKDVQTAQIAPLVKLYAAPNPYNDIFEMNIAFEVGTNARPCLSRVPGYVNLLGTADKSFDEIHDELQKMGSSLYFYSSEDNFGVSLDGFDDKLGETLQIASDLLANIKGDKKKLLNCKSEEKSGLIMNRSDMDELANALRAKVRMGDNSSYLVDKGEFSDAVLLGAFHDVQKVECEITYTGNLPVEEVAKAIAAALDVEAVTVASDEPLDKTPVSYDGPQVFFVDKKDASQSHIYATIFTDTMPTMQDRLTSNTYGSYLGGGMSSLLFQEIREFRSMAYSTNGYFIRPNYKNRAEIPVMLTSFVGTQCDKTIEAMQIVDSLVTRTPFVDTRLALTKKEQLNKRVNQNPSFRGLPAVVASNLRNGLEKDTVDEFMENLEATNVAALEDFWGKYVSGRPVVWCIVGNSKKMDMAALEQFGPITTLTAKDIMK